MKNAEISILITQGRAFKSSSFLLRTLKNKDILHSRPAFLTPKKVFKSAVERNRARRRIKSALYTICKPSSHIYSHNMMVFMLYKEILSVEYSELVNELKTILKKSDIINF